MWNMDSTENLANAPFAEFIYGCKVTESLWEATWIHLTSAPSLLWKTNFFGHPTCSAMFFYQQDHRELRYSQSHLEGDRPRNTAKRGERHLKLFVSKKKMKKLCQRKKKGLHTVLIPIDAIIPMDHGKSDLSTSPTMTERAVRRKRSWRTKRWERKAGTENDNEKTATSRPRARQRRRQGNDQENGDADATKITSNNVTIPYLRIKCTKTKQNICHRQSVGSIHSLTTDVGRPSSDPAPPTSQPGKVRDPINIYLGKNWKIIWSNTTWKSNQHIWKK